MLESAIPYAGEKRPPETQVVSREAGDKGESLYTLSTFVGEILYITVKTTNDCSITNPGEGGT